MRNLYLTLLLMFFSAWLLPAQSILHMEEAAFMAYHSADTVMVEDLESASGPNQTVFDNFDISFSGPTSTTIGGSRWGTDPNSGARQYQVQVANADTVSVQFNLNRPAIGFGLYLGDIHDANNDSIKTEIKIWIGEPDVGTLVWHSAETFEFDTGTAENLNGSGDSTLVGNGVNTFISFSTALPFDQITIEQIDPHGQQSEHFVFDDIIIAEAIFTLNSSSIPFHAVQHQDAVELQWKVLNEKEVHYFLLERSESGLFVDDFHVIPAQFSGKRGDFYTHKDSDIYQANTLYYRLQVVYKDGNKEEADIVAVRLRDIAWEDITVFPNPFINQLQFASLPETAKYLYLMDNQGRIIIERPIESLRLNYLDVSNLPAGNYYFSILSDTEKSIHQVVKH